MSQDISGIHHITTIAEDPQKNIDFYAGVLGLRLVKVTVNFDDPGSYHFYYGDAAGHPGTILTLVAWPGGQRRRRGSSQVTCTPFAVPPRSMPFWVHRFATGGIPFEPVVERFGAQVITFFDSDMLKLELIESASADGRCSDGPGKSVDLVCAPDIAEGRIARSDCPYSGRKGSSARLARSNTHGRRRFREKLEQWLEFSCITLTPKVSAASTASF